MSDVSVPGGAFRNANLARGSNQSGVRAYNERLVLALIRRHETLARAEIARLTGLSAQTISVIIRALEQDGLIYSGDRIRGRIGQPSLPMRLSPDGAFSFGLKIGRRSAELILLDFLGNIRQHKQITYKWPLLDEVISFTLETIDEFTATLDESKRHRIVGLGIAIPFEIWNWIEETGAATADMQAWLNADLAGDLGRKLPYPVYTQNDCTAACGAELNFGRGSDFVDFVYFFIGSFIGGGVVLNSTLYPGRTGNAGALGSMPMHLPTGAGRPTEKQTGQLIDTASLFVLERELQQSGQFTDSLWTDPNHWRDFGKPLDEWITNTAKSLAHAAVAAVSVIDFSAAIIDGWVPPEIRRRIVEETQSQLALLDLQGLIPPQIVEGIVGAHAKAMGAACLPLSHQYMFDQNVLFKEAQ